MNQYKTAVDLRRAIEARLKSDAETKGTDYGRLRRIVVFDRIAARLSASDQAWLIKGGTAPEFRLGPCSSTTGCLPIRTCWPRSGMSTRSERHIRCLPASPIRHQRGGTSIPC
jgi:hypothetical protein